MSDQQKPQEGGPAIGLPEGAETAQASAASAYAYGQKPDMANAGDASGYAPAVGAYAYPSGGYAQNPYNYTRPYAPPAPRTAYAFVPGDAVFAVFAFALGFLCWELQLFSTFGGFLILVIALIGSAVYLQLRGIRQTPRSLFVLGVCIAGALPLLLYDRIEINLWLMLFDLCACFYWVLVSAGNSIESRLSGFVFYDLINQIFVIPFSNFAGVFISVKSAFKNKKRSKSVLIGLVGLVIAIPLIIGITSLLIRSDQGFARFARDLGQWINMDDIGVYLLEICGGIPIACYLFGAVIGNVQKRYTTSVTKSGAEKSLAAAHRIPKAAILTPLAVLCILYIVYIAVMSIYLFSAFKGILPAGFSTYAEYARQGFFELCGVAAINLFVLAFTYGFAKRGPGEYPTALRALTGLLCVMTELLVVTAVSRMLLYIEAYGLSRLRVYTLWFLALLFVVFAILLIWHIRPYVRHTASGERRPINAGKPIVIVAVCFMLALFLANTDGLIAKYNVWLYENGHRDTVDTYMLVHMSDAVLPHLAYLAANAKDQSVRVDAVNAIISIKDRREYDIETLSGAKDIFRDWNIQTAMTQKYLPEQVSGQ